VSCGENLETEFVIKTFIDYSQALQSLVRNMRASTPYWNMAFWKDVKFHTRNLTAIMDHLDGEGKGKGK